MEASGGKVRPISCSAAFACGESGGLLLPGAPQTALTYL